MKSTREKVLLLVLAPLGVCAIYAFLFASKQEAALLKVEEQVKGLRAKGDPRPQLAMKSARANELQEKLTKLRADKVALTAQWNQLAGTSAEPGRRNERVERLTTIFKQYGLTVIEQGEASGQNAPAALDLVTKKLAEGGDRHKPQLWRVVVAGSYTDLLGALKFLADGEPLAVPLNVTMKEASLATDVREWTLLMWI